MYHVSAQGVDERMINVPYYYHWCTGYWMNGLTWLVIRLADWYAGYWMTNNNSSKNNVTLLRALSPYWNTQSIAKQRTKNQNIMKSCLAD